MDDMMSKKTSTLYVPKKNLEYQKGIDPNSPYLFMSIEELLDHILEKYKEVKQQKLSRYSLEWGKWSSEMNRCIRKRIDDKDSNSLQLKYVFKYWIIQSQTLELHYGAGLMAKIKTAKLNSEAKKLRKMIFEGELEDVSFNPLEIIPKWINELKPKNS